MQANNAQLRTNDQVLSLTDQMNLGVRSVELDTHWFNVRCLMRCFSCWRSQCRAKFAVSRVTSGLHTAVAIMATWTC